MAQGSGHPRAPQPGVERDQTERSPDQASRRLRHHPPAPLGASAPPPGAHHALADTLTALLEGAAAGQALWAVFVRSLDSGRE